MRNAMRLMTCAALVAATAVLGSQTVAQSKNPSTFRPDTGSGNGRIYLLSEAAATRLSAFGTLIPIGLGVFIASTRHGREYQYHYDSDWYGGPYTATIHEGPDQTVPALLISSGIIIGPSLGYFYAGKPGRAFAGMGLRTAIGFGALIGAFATCGWGCGPGEGAYDAAWGMMALGGAVVVGSAIHDISNADNAVRAQNQKRQNPRLSVIPEYFPGHKAFGLRAKITF
jgi:hypothetical protein